jgi:hypothetical protein
MNNLPNLKREKRAYIAYLGVLLLTDFCHEDTLVEDEYAVSTEIEITQAHLDDLDILIHRLETDDET